MKPEKEQAASTHSIHLKFCRIDYQPNSFVVTHFPDGTHYGATPADTEEYKALATRCGYESTWDYCIEHEVAHSLVAEHIYSEPSRVIWGCARGKFASMVDILHEEELSVSLQAFARGGVLPASSAPGFSWFRLRDIFLEAIQPTT